MYSFSTDIQNEVKSFNLNGLRLLAFWFKVFDAQKLRLKSKLSKTRANW